MAVTIESVPVAHLKPAAWNPRLLRDSRFQQLCRSLQADPDFLEQRPVLAQSDGTVYAGNMRLRAALHLGWETIPAIVADVPEHLAKERALKDNNQFGEWQEQELAALLAELQTQGAEIETLGFPEGFVDGLISEPNFDPVGMDEQGRLDQKKPVQCPECGHEFVPAP